MSAGPLGVLLLTAMVVSLLPVGSGLSDRAEQDGIVEWRFLSPTAVPLDEGLHLTCHTQEDLRYDAIAVDDPLNEHVRLTCDVGVGTYCDYPSWTPAPLQNPAFCGNAAEINQCYGTLYNFSGTLRIVPLTDDSFEVTYDGTYDHWDGNC